MEMNGSDSDWDSSPEANEQGSPKKGRRAAATVASSKTDLNAGVSSSMFGKSSLESGNDVNALGDGSAFAPPKPPRRRTGGWAETSTGTKSAKGSRENDLDMIANEDNQNDGMTIPDLDDFQEEEMAGQIAKAPHVAVNRVATYRELDSDLSKHSAFSMLDDIDLKCLTKYLSPESEIREADIPWTWDSLVADVSSRLSRDIENGVDK